MTNNTTINQRIVIDTQSPEVVYWTLIALNSVTILTLLFGIGLLLNSSGENNKILTWIESLLFLIICGILGYLLYYLIANKDNIISIIYIQKQIKDMNTNAINLYSYILK